MTGRDDLIRQLRSLAELVGVTESTMRKWKNEYNLADWVKLAQVGCKRPEGL